MDGSSILVFVFATWAVLLVVRQIDRRSRLTRFILRCTRILLPRWGLFASDLRRLDMYIYIRDFRDDGSTSEWTNVTPGQGDRKMFGFRERRLVASFLHRAQDIAYRMPLDSPFVSDLDDARAMMATSNYRTLLFYARAQPASVRAERRQFLIAVRPHPRFEGHPARAVPGFAEEDRVPRLVTGFHPLPASTPRVQTSPASIVTRSGSGPPNRNQNGTPDRREQPVAVRR